MHQNGIAKIFFSFVCLFINYPCCNWSIIFTKSILFNCKNISVLKVYIQKLRTTLLTLICCQHILQCICWESGMLITNFFEHYHYEVLSVHTISRVFSVFLLMRVYFSYFLLVCFLLIVVNCFNWRFLVALCDYLYIDLIMVPAS